MLGIAGLVLMVIVGLSYREWAQYSRANTDAAQTREIVDSAERLLSGLLDAETGQREFLLTGENRYLGRYNQALQSVPSELAQLKGMLAARPAEADNAARLSDLVSRRLEHLRQTIQVRRTQGLAAATAEVLSGEGKRMMDEIRTLCAQIQRTETSAQNQASLEGEAAARGVLLVTVAGSLVLLFFLAVGLGPFVSGDHQTDPGRWFVRYGAAVLATIAAVLLRMALTPLVGATAVPFITFFPAVLIAAWFGGFRPAVLSIVLSTLAADYLFIPPVKSLVMPNAGDQITLLIFVVVGFGMALLSDAQRRAVERAKRAENSERVERQRFETTLASIGDAVIATDSQRRVTFANKVALSLVGWPEDEMLAKPLDEVFCIVNEYTRAAVESPVAKVLREGAIVGLANHTVLLARDGTEVPIDDSAAPIRDGSGTIAGTVLVFRDITERRRAERISQRLASIVESSEDAIISKDLCGIVTTWNLGAEHMLGYSAAEMIGQPISLLAPPGHSDEMPRILERISRGERVDQFQTVRRTKGGNIIHASVTVSPVYDAGGQVTGASKIIRDITAQVRAQEEVAEHRERLRVTLSSIGDAVIATDTAGRVSYLNPVAEQLTGWTSAEASGRPLEEVFRIVDEESRKTAENPVIKVLREGQTVGLANHTVLIAKDGREIAIDDSAAPIRDAHGAMVGVVLIFRDITDRRRMERQLHKSAERLEAALDAGSMGVWDWDIASGKVTWSPNLEAIHGIDRGSFGGTFEAFLSDVHPDHLASVKQSISRSLDAKSDHDIEYRIVVPGGSVHWIHGKGRVVVDAAGNPIGMTGLCMDISGRKHAEEDLRRRAEEIQALVDATPAFVWFGHDAQCSRITGNQAANRLLGTAPGANLSQTPGDGSAIAIKHFAPDGHEIPPDQLPMQTAVATRQPVANTELEIRFGDGRGVHLLGNATPLFDISGEVRGCVAAFVDITERKQAEQQFHLAVEAAPNGMVVADADGEIVLVNASTERMFGYTREELIGRPVELLVPERFRNSHQRDRHNFLSGPEVRPMGAGRDLHGRRKDGSEFPVEIGLNPIQTEGGTLVLGSIIDITERRDAEVTRHLLASVVESSVDAVITKDLNGRVTSWNRGAERMFGYSAEQMIGQTISVIVPPAHTEETFEALERVKRGEAIAQHETVRQTKDGATIVVSVTWSPIRDDRGRIVGASKVVRDITERKKAEDALRQSEERLATVMKHLPVGVGVVDRDGHVVIGNPSWKQFLRGDIPSVDPAEGARWRAMTPDGQPLAPSEYPGLRALRGEDVLPGIDFLRKEDDGEERWTRVSAVPLRDKTGQITGALVMLQDIDEERRAQAQRAELLAKERALETEKALREMESELARVTRALSVGELATSIAHEVNQPLAGVVTNAEAALRWLSGETPDIQEAKESLALIGRDANRAAAVIKRIREFLKKEGPQTVPLKVNDVIQEAVELARAEFAKRGISLRMNLSTDIPHVYGDRIQLQQVVLNLMMNAAEAMASTQDAKELLLLSEKSPDGVVLLAVRDHGAGLSAEDMPRMFDAFFTTKPAGMGMGLSISRSIVESHGGRIWAECNDGPGLTVRLALPAGNDGS